MQKNFQRFLNIKIKKSVLNYGDQIKTKKSMMNCDDKIQGTDLKKKML